MPDQFGDKVFEPTPYRRQKAREEGQVARSQDLASAALLVGAVLVLKYFGQGLFHFFGLLAEQQLGGEAWLQVDAQVAAGHWNSTLFHLARALVPIFLLLLLLAVIVHMGQIGILFLPKKLLPDVSRIDPLKGAKRLASLGNVVRLGFGVFKIGIVVAVALWSIYDHRATILALGVLEVNEGSAAIFNILVSTCLKIGIALLILAILDYGFQRWKHTRDLRMTQQEMREELKHLQGDQQTLARRRTIQRQMVMNQLRTAVPNADVVVTNPTELAVAIKYDPLSMDAPIVVAKGAGTLAARIRRLALEHSIPVVERKPLAQALYKNVDINQPIPAEQYAAVAELLRYVYELQGRTLPGQNAA